MNQACDARKKRKKKSNQNHSYSIGQTWDLCYRFSFGVSKLKKGVGTFESFQGTAQRIKSLENQPQIRMA